jgi:membrane-associated phospholipid phosphatase
MSHSERRSQVWFVVLFFAASALLAAGLLAWDQPTLEAVRRGYGDHWRGLAGALSFYGDFPWLLGAGLLGLAVAWFGGSRSWSRIFTAMILASIVAGLLSNLIKLGTGRVRPRVEEVAHGWYGTVHGEQMVALQHGFQAFPSSHAACAFGFFIPLFFARRGWGSLGLLAAAAVAWSRVQLNAHHISDVAAGGLLGLIVGWYAWRWIVQRGALARWLDPAG